MSTLTRSRPPRPPMQTTDGPTPPTPPPALTPQPTVSDDLMTVGLLVLMLAAIVPIRGVFIGQEWVRPVVGAVVLSLGIGWGARRLGVGPITHLVMSIASLAMFVTIAFLPTTAVGGLLPTATTLSAMRALFVRGLELVELRPSPTFAEAGLLLLAVGGAWVISYLADGLLFVLRSPAKAIIAALVLWSVPLSVAPEAASIAIPSVTLLGASALLLLLGNTAVTSAYGVRVAVQGHRVRTGVAAALPLPGVTLSVLAIVVGLIFASVLPGFRAEPLYAARGGTGTTITTNPIVDIRQRLVATDTGPVLMVSTTSERPLYLRTTSLDTYDANEQWTAGTISGQRVQGTVDTPPAIQTERVDVDVEIANSIETGAVLAPAPYQPIRISGAKAAALRYDRRSATVTVPAAESLVPGDSYTVSAAVPQPNVEALRLVPVPGVGTAGTLLPPNVPAAVTDLARQIVDEAGAVTMFDMALAVQDRLRSWNYSLTPEPGLGGTAMLRFIDAQEGYCEQFAGTMAVMLRTLGIPTRLAVGYTPGTLQSDGRYEITNGNAHAWVEVDFGLLGWVTFEPTPRSDDNVLVPSAGAIVPSQTVAQQAGLGTSGADPAGPGALNDVRDAFDVPTGLPTAPVPSGVPGTGSTQGGANLWIVLLGLLAVGGVAGAVLLRRDHTSASAAPQARIIAARTQVERVGRAAGRARHVAETDEEYLTRIAGGSRAAMLLADPATRAVYAPAVTDLDADQAERAGRHLTDRLTVSLPWWRRVAVRAWMTLTR